MMYLDELFFAVARLNGVNWIAEERAKRLTSSSTTHTSFVFGVTALSSKQYHRSRKDTRDSPAGDETAPHSCFANPKNGEVEQPRSVTMRCNRIIPMYQDSKHVSKGAPPYLL